MGGNVCVSWGVHQIMLGSICIGRRMGVKIHVDSWDKSDETNRVVQGWCMKNDAFGRM